MTEMTEADAAERENLWAKEMLQIYDEAAAIGYKASGFRGLVASHGPLRAAKMLINEHRAPSAREGGRRARSTTNPR
jgi:hypothetical protein